MNKRVTLLEKPYQLTLNPTIKSGNTMALTCTGGITGIPMEATGVLLVACCIKSNSVEGFVQIGPHGADLSEHVRIEPKEPLDDFFYAFAMVRLSSNQIDIKANNGDIVLQNWQIFGYIV